MTKPKLRKRKPYTCRFVISGKPCADYLSDADGNYCAKHTEAVNKFMNQKREPVTTNDAPVIRRIWP